MTRLILLFSISLLIFTSCTKDQYKGEQMSERRQVKLKDEHNNFHVRETIKTLDKNARTKEKREKKAVQYRLASQRLNVETAKRLRACKRKSLEFDFY
ncbi:MAG: hypothetical protein ACK40G_01425 [Cytophagaceae bacterium]